MTDVDRLMRITDLLNAVLRDPTNPKASNFIQTAFFLSHKTNKWLEMNMQQIEKDCKEAVDITKVF
jgi:hypothetical protein